MSIWLFYESDGRWGIRAGNRWLSAKSVDIRIPLKGVLRHTQPKAYLKGQGRVELVGTRARLVS